MTGSWKRFGAYNLGYKFITRGCCEDSFLYSTKLLLFFPLKISTRYPHFEDSAGIGKLF
jgi:hypothetical protein